MLKKLKIKILSLLIKSFYKPLDVNKLVTFKGSEAYLGNRKLDKSMIKDLTNQIKTFRSFMIYDLLNEYLKYEAINQTTVNSTDMEQVFFGKAMIYNINVTNDFFKKIEIINDKENAKQEILNELNKIRH